eukprot:COSAG03_NODE_15308_length_434_cov_6.955224_1_plen_24_part_10
MDGTERVIHIAWGFRRSGGGQSST